MAVIKKLKAVKIEQNHLLGIQDISFSQVSEILNQAKTFITLNKSVDWLRKYEPIKNTIEDIKTATLWKKNKSTFDPDFCAVRLPDNPWIVQPFEQYEEIRIEDIKKKHHK